MEFIRSYSIRKLARIRTLFKVGVSQSSNCRLLLSLMVIHAVVIVTEILVTSFSRGCTSVAHVRRVYFKSGLTSLVGRLLIWHYRFALSIVTGSSSLSPPFDAAPSSLSDCRSITRASAVSALFRSFVSTQLTIPTPHLPSLTRIWVRLSVPTTIRISSTSPLFSPRRISPSISYNLSVLLSTAHAFGLSSCCLQACFFLVSCIFYFAHTSYPTLSTFWPTVPML